MSAQSCTRQQLPYYSDRAYAHVNFEQSGRHLEDDSPCGPRLLRTARAPTVLSTLVEIYQASSENDHAQQTYTCFSDAHRKGAQSPGSFSGEINGHKIRATSSLAQCAALACLPAGRSPNGERFTRRPMRTEAVVFLLHGRFARPGTGTIRHPQMYGRFFF